MHPHMCIHTYMKQPDTFLAPESPAVKLLPGRPTKGYESRTSEVWAQGQDEDKLMMASF